MGLPLTVLGKLEHALAAEEAALPKVIWLNGSNCSGCTVSLANLFSESGPTDIADLLFNTIDLAFHPTLMAASGDLAVQQLKDTAQGSYILAIDGGIPTAFDGNTCILWSDGGKEVTALEAVEMLAPNAAAVLSIGTCASYGGIPAAAPNPTGVVSVSELVGSKTINIPGCPTHPDWIVWTVAHLLAGETPQLDELNRPAALYATEIHQTCPRRGQEKAQTFGIEQQCLMSLGCKGPETKSDCPSRKWNNGTNWCIGAGGLCIGCTESDFPDKFSPFYLKEYGYKQFDKPAPEDPSPSEPKPEEPPGSKLRITRIDWHKERRTLKVEGKGEGGLIVSIYDADSGNQLGAVSVSEAGRWKFRLKKPSTALRRLQATSGGESVSFDVRGDRDRERQRDEWHTRHKEWHKRHKNR